MHKRLFILGLFCLLPSVAFAVTPGDVETIMANQATEPSTDWLALDATLGVTGTGESLPSARALSAGYGAGELMGALSLTATDWGGEDCTPFCGPLWTNRLGARLDVEARGLAQADASSKMGTDTILDLHIDQSAELALWFVSIGQTFSYQQESAFWRTFWRPHANTMSAGVKGGGSILAGADQTGGVEVGSIYADWRRLVGTGEDPPADEVRLNIALIDGVAPPGSNWYERFGLGLVTVDLYGVLVGREGETKVTEEATNLVFNFGRIEGFRVWNAPWKLDATLGIAGISPIAEVRRTTVTDPNGDVSVDYSGVGPMVVSPNIWFAAHHMGEHDYRLMSSVIFESIPVDANFGIGAGSFSRLDASAFAADVGAQVAAYARLPVTSNLSLRAEALGIAATRRLVSELATDLPIKADETFFMGRAEVGVDWALGHSWTLSANTWAEHSDREMYVPQSESGPTSRLGVRAGLYWAY